MAGTASVGGLISGLDTNDILDQLWQVAQAPIQRLEDRKSQLNERLTAWAAVEGHLLSLQTTAAQLAAPATFQAKTATVSRSDIVSATASAAAAAGTYTFIVNQLAQTHQMVSGGYADTNETEFGSGTISITVGDADPVVIQTEGLTLSELRDAINASEAEVTAAIINDGDPAIPYRLVISSNTSGLEGEMEIVTNGGAPTLTELQAAQEAEITLGSGAGAITIHSGSNTVTGAVPGVTLQLLKADPATSVSVTVARDTGGIQSKITTFVGLYNALVAFFSEQFDYDPETNTAGTLFADFRLQSLQNDLSAAVTSQVIGLSGVPRALADLGVRTLSTGELSVDSSVLANALLSDPDSVTRVFAAVGSSTDAAVSYLSSTTETRPSGAAGWEVEITQAARQARVTAGVAQTASLGADETVTIQGVPIYLTAGMTQAEVIAEINSQQALTGVSAEATDANGEGTGNYLTLTRVSYGSTYHITAVSSRSNQGGNDSSGIGNVEVSDQDPEGESGTGTGAVGLDMAGTIGGWEATGSGQRLTAQEGDAEGLTVLVTATSPGSYGNVAFTVGAAESAYRVAVSGTDVVTGTVVTAQDSITDLIGGMEEEIARLQTLIEAEQERLSAAFRRMEEALGRFQTQSQFLSRYIGQIEASAGAGS